MAEAPEALDVCCGSGGASMGYKLAGFTMTGVDLHPKPDYPFELLVDEATSVLRYTSFLNRFALVHVSPPCQRYSLITPPDSREKHPDLIPKVRELLMKWGGPWIIENVPNSPLIDPIKLCGSAFGLGVQRHRMFETNMKLRGTVCQHHLQRDIIGVYGRGGRTPIQRPTGKSRGTKAPTVADAQRAMGIDWMPKWNDLADAIPPAYTQHLGNQVIAQLGATA